MEVANERAAATPENEKSPKAEELVESAIRHGSVDERILEHSHDADEALKAFAGHEGQVIEIDEATNKALLRKIDWNLIPVSVRGFRKINVV